MYDGEDIMKLRTRRFFFYSLVVLFLFLGGVLVLAANGLVIDIKNLRIEKTGAIYLRYAPQNAAVYLNGALQHVSPGFLSSGVFLSNLAPGEYSVRLASSGRTDWTKELTVTPGLVAAESQVELWPQTWPFEPAGSSSAADFWLTSAGPLIKTPAGALKIAARTVGDTNVVLSSPNQPYVVTKAGQEYWLTDVSSPAGTSTNLTRLFDTLRHSKLGFTGTVPIEQVLYHPFDGSRLIIVSVRAVYLLDPKAPSLSVLFEMPSIAAADLSGNQLFAVNASGTLAAYNLLLQTESTSSPGIGNVVQIKSDPSGAFIFLLDRGGTLTEYDRSTQAASTLAQNVTGFWPSLGGDRLAYATASGELHFVALKNYWTDIKVVQGDTWSVSYSGGAPQDFAWLPDFPNYGFVLSNGTLSAVELDQRLPQNSAVVAQGVSKFIVNGSTAYLLKTDGTLELLDLGNL